MKKFIVDEKVFELLPDYCLGVVVASGFDNAAPNEKIEAMLDRNAQDFAARHAEDNVRELSQWKPLHPEIVKRRRCWQKNI